MKKLTIILMPIVLLLGLSSAQANSIYEDNYLKGSGQTSNGITVANIFYDIFVEDETTQDRDVREQKDADRRRIKKAERKKVIRQLKKDSGIKEAVKNRMRDKKALKRHAKANTKWSKAHGKSMAFKVKAIAATEKDKKYHTKETKKAAKKAWEKFRKYDKKTQKAWKKYQKEKNKLLAIRRAIRADGFKFNVD